MIQRRAIEPPIARIVFSSGGLAILGRASFAADLYTVAPLWPRLSGVPLLSIDNSSSSASIYLVLSTLDQSCP